MTKKRFAQPSFKSIALLCAALTAAVLCSENIFAQTTLPPTSDPFAKTVWPVGVRKLNWTGVRSNVQIEAIAYCPIGRLEPSPVVIFSHGLGSSPERFEYLGTMWASRGLIAVFPRHPATDETQWHGTIRPLNELKELYQKYWSARDRALTISFIIDRFEEIAGKDGTIGQFMDTSRIGVAGNDLGALAAALLAGQLPPDNGPSLKDPRVTAVIAVSPPVYCTPGRGKIVYANIKTPFLSFAGTRDDGLAGTTHAAERRIPFDSISGVPHYHVTLEGADHLVCSGHISKTKQSDDRPYQDTIRNLSFVFWSAYLLDDHQALALLDNAAPTFLSNVGLLERKPQ